MECSICKERARGAQEFARVGAWVFDVTKAKQIAAMKKIRQISVEEVRSTALPPPPREGYTSLGGFAVDEEHLSHIPDPTEPVIIGIFPTPPRLKKNDLHFVLDGHHHMVRAAHEGRGVSACFLTMNETRRCMMPNSLSQLRRLREQFDGSME
ncbi:MAG TPA: hypothetical protein VMU57_12585 [Edaphobacter sp.]|uniref:hypothetical protein n=1 Tax=Edaphobacter sp. TaxID=1934404 RepID=UPI002B50AED1|nr:hypothetical protein [Edaphobacter sp.]HUZ95738.1 hypothetical protein [Edaphobacter sp.]